MVCHNVIRYDSLITHHISEEYYHNGRNDIQLQSNANIYRKDIKDESESPKYLFDHSESNNFLSLDIHTDGHLKDTNACDVTVEYDATENVGFSQIRKAGGAAISIKKNIANESQVSPEEINIFFFDDPNSLCRPLPPHTIEESPCRSIIGIDNHSFYYCTVHQDIQNINLESIEHHCKFKDREMHYSEVQKSLGIYKSISP
jgi:hypothetical protein